MSKGIVAGVVIIVAAVGVVGYRLKKRRANANQVLPQTKVLYTL
jgi:hypothetical protein